MGINVSDDCEESEWLQAHEVLSRLAQERAIADAEEGRWLLAALRAGTHVHLGHGSFGEYVERLFGYKPRSTQEKLRVAEALEGLPGMAAALEVGTINWSAVRELTRVAVAETEQEWLEVACGKTVHQLEGLVAGKPRGARPDSATRPEARRHVLRFDVAAETLCLFREAISKLHRESGTALDDDAALMLMARHVLGGPENDGRANYQIALSICPQCRVGAQQATGELLPVGAEVVEMAECDAQHLGLLPASVSQRTSAAEQSADAHVGARVEGGQSADAHVGARAEGGQSADAHVGARVEGGQSPDAHVGARATQGIPPATRRTVLRRDHHRCTVPGCRNSRFVDLHHIELTSEGGDNQAANIITLCGAHHRAAHRGELVVTGNADEGVRFQHADGNDYGRSVDPRAIHVQSKVFGALRNMGFREGETRRVLTEIWKGRGVDGSSIECVLREALARLTRSADGKGAPKRS